ncbi:MAG: hypothetical protein AABX40_01240, partial [Candidatus Hydrothermarchaeota archaeon]
AFAGTHALWALKAGNILLSLASLLLVYLLAQRMAPGTGPWAAVLLALNPIDIATSSASYTEPMALVLILSTLYLLSMGHRYGSPLIALVLLAAALTRYEAWLLIPILAFHPGAGLRGRRAVLLPALLFIVGWSLHLWTDGPALLARSESIVLYEASKGAIAPDLLARLGNLFVYALATSPMVYVLGMAQGWRMRGYLPSFLFLHLAILSSLTFSGAGVGSFRYLSLPAAFLSILAGVSRSRLLPLALASSLILLPYYLPLFNGLGSLYGPMVRAGEFVGAQEVEGSVLANSPIPLYYSGLPVERLLGPFPLPGGREGALQALDSWGVEDVIASDLPSRITYLSPGLGLGKPDEDFILTNSTGGWEIEYGGREAHVYRYRRFGRYRG